MIVVNLLPEELRPIKRTPLPHLASLLVLVLALAGMAATYLAMAADIGSRRDRLAATEQELASLADTVAEFKELKKKKEQLDRKISVIQDITKDRIIWSKRLHQLVSLTPDNFWYKSIQETTKTTTVERDQLDEKGNPVIDPKTGQVKTVRERVKLPYLVIAGYVAPDDEGSDDVNPLSFETSSDDEFSNLFVLESPEASFGEFRGRQIRTFKFNYRIAAGEND